MAHWRWSIVALGLGLGAVTPRPQTPLPAPPPTTSAAVGAWDAALVERAATTIASSTQWNRLDTGTCGAAGTSSISCALQKAVEESAGIRRDSAGRRIHQEPALSDCRFRPAGSDLQGSCGVLFDELPVFRIGRTKDVKTGKWRADPRPEAVWAGRMSDAESPVTTEAPKVIALISSKRYPDPLRDYNNDPTTTFADVQTFFRRLEEQVIKHAAADLAESSDDVEIELYAGGSGVMRTYAGWYPVSGAVSGDTALTFRMDADHEAPANSLDREILQHANAILASDAEWNRADNRKCPSTATTWSIYCAEERASVEVTGGFHHRRPALEVVRQIVDKRSEAKKYHHRLMEYNNDPATRIEDVRSLFAEAIAAIR